jgi:heat-inducible transcriptional repressor
MVILVLGQGWVKEELVTLSEPVRTGEIAKLAQLMNSKFGGLTLSEIRDSLIREAESLKEARLTVIESVLKLIDGALRFNEDKIQLEGASHLMEQPECRNLKTMEQVLRLVDEKEPLAQALGRQWLSPGLSVEIGGEFPEASMREFSFVHVPYRFQGKVAGALGVLGPTRMPYDRIAGIVHYLARSVEKALDRGKE